MKLFEADMAGLQRDIATLQRCGCLGAYGVGVFCVGPTLLDLSQQFMFPADPQRSV